MSSLFLSFRSRLLTELIAKPSEAIVICAVSEYGSWRNFAKGTLLLLPIRSAGQNYLCLWLKTGTLLFSKPPLGSFSSVVREFERKDHRLIRNSNKSTSFQKSKSNLRKQDVPNVIRQPQFNFRFSWSFCRRQEQLLVCFINFVFCFLLKFVHSTKELIIKEASRQEEIEADYTPIVSRLIPALPLVCSASQSSSLFFCQQSSWAHPDNVLLFGVQRKQSETTIAKARMTKYRNTTNQKDRKSRTNWTVFSFDL